MEATQHKTVNRAASFKPAAILKPVQASGIASRSTLRIQTALKVSSPSDPAEKEAESSAKTIMRMQVPERSLLSVEKENDRISKQGTQDKKEENLPTKRQSPLIARFASSGIFAMSDKEEKQVQRQSDEGAKEEEKVQRKADDFAEKEEGIQRKTNGSAEEKEQIQRQADETSENEEQVQRQTDKSGEKDEKLSRRADGQPNVSSGIASELQQNVSNGKPLPLNVRRFMEPRFKADFSKVKIHTDDRAAKLNRNLNAQAFTLGNQIFFGKGKFKPESDEGKELIAHELTHTVQQGAAIRRREAVSITQSSPPKIQRLGISDAWNYFADKANLIPGFRMFTIVLGVNPINMSRVDRSAANVMRAVIEFIPGGSFITQALDNHGIFDKVSAWVGQQIQTLGLVGSSIRQAVSDFLNSLGWRDIFSLGSVWSRAKRIFTAPITRIINFVKGLVSGIVTLIKDAILRPIASLAEGTRGYDLLKAVLGQDPITGDPHPRTAETLIGGFMKLIGQEDVWNNIQQANALPRAWAWFQGAMASLMGFVVQIPSLFLAAFMSLELVDIILLPRAFAKLVGVFSTFMGQFISWAGNAVWNLLEIIFTVVAPGVMPFIKRASGAFRSILQNPIGFVGNLVRAAKQGFQQFAAKIAKHLRTSLIQWLTGAMGAAGVYIPQSFSIREIIKFVLSVLGLTWKNIRVKLVRAVGEGAVKAMETGFDLVATLVREGPAAAWEKIKEGLSNLKQIVIEGIMNFVVTKIVQQAVLKLVMMINPAGAVIQAIIAIYNTILFFIERLQQIIQVATAFINSISAIASGVIAAAANRVEQTLAGMLTLAISFLARFAGLGKVSTAIMKIINKIRAPIDRALNRIVSWIVTLARKLGRFVAQAGVPKDPKKRLALAAKAAVSAARRLKGKVTKALLKPILSGIKIRYGLKEIEPYEQGGTWWVKASINPTKKQNTGVSSSGASAAPDADKQKAAQAFQTRLFARKELQPVLSVSTTTANQRLKTWMQESAVFKLASAPSDPLTLYSFDASKAGQRETNPNNRSKYGYSNPSKSSGVGLQILSVGLIRKKSPKPILFSNAAYHQTKAWYKSVVSAATFKFPRAILGHKDPGASGHWNHIGHTQAKASNMTWNRLVSSYQGPEDKAESSASGGSAKGYRVPSKTAGSHSSWY